MRGIVGGVGVGVWETGRLEAWKTCKVTRVRSVGDRVGGKPVSR